MVCVVSGILLRCQYDAPSLICATLSNKPIKSYCYCEQVTNKSIVICFPQVDKVPKVLT